MKAREARKQALHRIEQAREGEDCTLDLGDLPLLDLPPALSSLTNLRVLVLGDRDFKNSDEEYHRRWWRGEGRNEYVERGFDNLEALRPLIELTDLGLSSCQRLSDINALSALTKLKRLDLRSCDLLEIAPLAALQDLQELDLSVEVLKSLWPLAELKHLRVLILRWCKGLCDLTPLAGLRGLQELDLTRCEAVDDVEPLARLVNLHSLDLSHCNLTDLTPLAGLRDLQELDLSGCEGLRNIEPLRQLTKLQSLNLSACTALDDLRPLSALSNLRDLDLGGERSACDLAPLAGLINLRKLSLTGWRSLRLSSIPRCPRLRELDLSMSHDLRDIRSLHNFGNLRKLDLSGCSGLRLTGSTEGPPTLRELTLRNCKASWAFEPLRPLLANLRTLQLYGSSFTDLPQEVIHEDYGGNSLDHVRAHFADLSQGEQRDAELKLFVLGNGGVGKTQLCRRLRAEPFDPRVPSTHGVQLGHVSLQADGKAVPIRLSCWDFGGQDIYHGTHALFLQSHAVFAVLWSPDLESGDGRERIGGMRNRPLAYWLDYVQGLAGTDCPVLVVQSRCDEDSQRRQCPAAIDSFSDIKLLHVSALSGLGLKHLTASLAEAVARLLETRPLDRIGIGRVQIRDRLRDALNQGQRTLTQQEFVDLCQEVGKVSDYAALLDFLHRCGTVFYRPGLFGDKIILDQTWALDAIYVLFHRETSLPLLAGDGRFTREQLAALVWRGLSEGEQEIILGMMRSCGLCFPIRKLSSDSRSLEYVAPDLLPEWSEAKDHLLGALRDGPPNNWATVRYRFLHEGILRTFLSCVGEHAGGGAMYWKYGCWFCEAKTEGVVLVRSKQEGDPNQPGSGEVSVEAWGNGAAELVDRVLATLLRIPVGQPPKVHRAMGRAVSRVGNDTLKGIEELDIVPRFSLPERGPRRVYVSYARQNDLIVHRLCERIGSWGYHVERDRDVARSGDLISDFIASIGRADCVVVVLSQNYLHSQYCMDELHRIYTHSRADKGDFLRRIVPLTLDDANIGTILDRANYALHWEAKCDSIRSLLPRNVIGTSDYASFLRISRWVGDVSEMLAQISDKLHPHGFDEICANDFATVRELLEQGSGPPTPKSIDG